MATIQRFHCSTSSSSDYYYTASCQQVPCTDCHVCLHKRGLFVVLSQHVWENGLSVCHMTPRLLKMGGVSRDSKASQRAVSRDSKASQNGQVSRDSKASQNYSTCD